MKIYLWFVSAVMLLFMFEPVLGEDNQLSVFEAFTSNEWRGHYSDSDDSNLVHIVRWEFYLDSLAVIQKKHVPDVGFESETYYYLDLSSKQISFLSLVNKNMFSKGRVEFIDGMVVMFGQTFYEGGESDFKKTYAIDETGKLIDRFYRKKDDQWVQGHLIVHDPVQK